MVGSDGFQLSRSAIFSPFRTQAHRPKCQAWWNLAMYRRLGSCSRSLVRHINQPHRPDNPMPDSRSCSGNCLRHCTGSLLLWAAVTQVRTKVCYLRCIALFAHFSLCDIFRSSNTLWHPSCHRFAHCCQTFFVVLTYAGHHLLVCSNCRQCPPGPPAMADWQILDSLQLLELSQRGFFFSALFTNMFNFNTVPASRLLQLYSPVP